MRLYEIGRDLYVSGSPKPTDVKKVTDAGIHSVYCLSKKRTPPEVIDAVPFWRYEHIPDGKTVPITDLRRIVGMTLTDLKHDQPVLIHCLGGRNRSMLAAVLVERARNGWSGEEAFQHARLIRPGSMTNEAFVEWLRSLP